MQESFSKLEAELQEIVLAFVTAVAEEGAPMLRQIQSHVIHEGHKTSLIRESGEVEDIDMKRFSSEATLSQNTLLYGALEEILESFRPIGVSMATEKERMIFQAVDEATKKTGNIVDNQGKPLSLDVLLEVLENIHIDFDKNGNARMPTLAVPPSMRERIEELKLAAESSEFKERFDRVVANKKVEWREREADRILVG